MVFLWFSYGFPMVFQGLCNKLPEGISILGNPQPGLVQHGNGNLLRQAERFLPQKKPIKNEENQWKR